MTFKKRVKKWQLISENTSSCSLDIAEKMPSAGSLDSVRFSKAVSVCLNQFSCNFSTVGFVLFTFVFLSQPMDAVAQLPRPEDAEDRCSPNRTNERRVCREGIIIPLWQPGNTSLLTAGDKAGRAIVYFLALVYLFLGVSIIADRFMAAIEVITSKEKEVVYKSKNGEVKTTTVRIWNETVSNLTLMALGSSAPEIMLSIIEICGKGFHAGDLGPSTIVGSASFNLFIIIAICMYVIPDGEVRRVKHPRVFFVTATSSVLAYIWLYIILAVSSYGVVDIWEGVVTFLFFPIFVVFAWVADRRLLLYKYMYKRYRTRRKNVIVETEGERTTEKVNDDNKTDGEACLHLTEIGENGKVAAEGPSSVADEESSSFYNSESTQELVDPDTSRKNMVKIMRDLKKKHPDADIEELARMATAEALSHQPKSRAFYRIQATRKMIGSGDILSKGKLDHLQSASSLEELDADDDDDTLTKIFFNPSSYRVLENCGFVELFVHRQGGDLRNTLFVDYKTEDGTANAGSDYVSKEDTIVFRPGETMKKLKIEIMDDDIFEEDEYFTVYLSNERLGTADGMFDTDENSKQLATLAYPSIAQVIILDDDHAGVFSFASQTMKVSEGDGVVKVEVQRNSGARGRVTVPYHTVSGTAKGGGVDYEDKDGELEFQNDETTSKPICVEIADSNKYYKRADFSIALGQPKSHRQLYAENGSDSGINGQDDKQLLTEEEEEERRIAELGKPRLGQYPTIEITIEESSEFKSTVDKLIKKANLAMVVGTSSWREQFTDAVSVKGGNGDGDDTDSNSSPTCFEYVMHFLTVFWKVIFACVPPTDYLEGWACFGVSILGIGFLTAIIQDVASQFGCIVNLNDAVTAVTLVAMGTSVPDTFASKVAAVGDQYADASIGNVTGSNAVNVFLGIGIAWTVAAIYWAVTGRTPEEQKFRVPPGNLAFSVTIFSVFACVAIFVLMYRRKSSKIKAELGGPKVPKTFGAIFFVLLWLVYILLSALDSYCIIQTF